jgi:hypothetical protein
VNSLRSFTRGHHWAAALIVALALALRALIPGGYMLSATPDGLAIVPCSAVFTPAPEPAAAGPHDHHLMVSHGGMDHAAIAAHAAAKPSPSSPKAEHEKHAAAQQACPYAVLSLASLAGTDPILLAAALAFVLALAFAPRPLPSFRRTPFLRPPLRAPPAPA